MIYLANELVEQGAEVELLVVDASGPLRPEIDERVRLTEMEAGGIIAALPFLVRYLRSRKPDALLSTLTHANVMTIWAGKFAGASARVFVREATTLSLAERKGIRDFVLPTLARFSYPRAGGVIAVSRGVADDLIAEFGVPAEKISVVYNPSYPRDVARLMSEPTDHPWFDGNGSPVLLSVGRMTEAKDYPTLIRAFAIARRKRDLRLAIVGDGELRDRLTDLIGELALDEHVSLPGFAGNPYAFMSRASLYVLSSIREGMPNALVQAMVCGCPVVATDCKSGPREVLEDGKYGRLVPTRDPDALAAAILAGLDEPTPATLLAEAAERFAPATIGAGYLRALLRRESSSTAP